MNILRSGVCCVPLVLACALFAQVACETAEEPEEATGRVLVEKLIFGQGGLTARAGFWGAFAHSVGMIMATEVGDKTFFIAAILAMKYSRLVVFGGAISALAVMTALSAALGFALPNLLPRQYTHYASVLLFVYFGVKMLKEGYEAEGGRPSEELAEVEEEIIKKKEGDEETGSAPTNNGQPPPTPKDRRAPLTVFTQGFTMTFLAEWGDRSQIATIALAAAKDVYGVVLGGILGHALCTGVAVLGGRMLAARISEKTVHLVGGALFLLFALHSLVTGADEDVPEAALSSISAR